MPKYRLVAEYEAKDFKSARAKFTKNNPDSLSIMRLEDEKKEEWPPPYRPIGFNVED